jgi:hypothetical protein
LFNRQYKEEYEIKGIFRAKPGSSGYFIFNSDDQNKDKIKIVK